MRLLEPGMRRVMFVVGRKRVHRAMLEPLAGFVTRRWTARLSTGWCQIESIEP
jgi:hypothetical protein